MPFKVSLIIPTRNRAEYLRHAINTCLACDDPDIEIIVSDNNSVDNTRQVVAGFHDKRIIYLNTGVSLSMRQNFEFSLQHATGDYLLYIGDDDGIFKNGFASLRRLLESHKPDVVNWRHITYIWPAQDEQRQDGIFKFRYRDFFGEAIEKNPKNILADLSIAKITNYRDGANIYHGCVSRKIIDRALKITPYYFMSQIPDVYTSIMNLVLAENFVWFRNPVTIAGESPKSNGAAFSTKSELSSLKKEITSDFSTLNQADLISDGIDPRIRSINAITYSLLSKVKKVSGYKLNIDHEAWRAKCRADIQSLPCEFYEESATLAELLFSEIDATYASRSIAKRDPVAFKAKIAKKRLTKLRSAQTHLRTTTDVAAWTDKITGSPYNPYDHQGKIGLLKKSTRIAEMLIRNNLLK